jgi:hypothetical protein
MSDKEMRVSRSKAFNDQVKESIDLNKKRAQRTLQFVLEWVLIVFL